MATVSFDSRRQFLIMAIIWLALAVTIVAYGALGYIMGPQIGLGSDLVGTMFPILVLVAAVEVGVQLWFRRLTSDEKLFPATLDRDRAARNPQLRAVADMPLEARGPAVMAALHMTFGIIMWALAESIAIYGLVLTLLSGDTRYVLGFALFALADMMWLFPRRAEFDAQVERWRRWALSRGQIPTP